MNERTIFDAAVEIEDPVQRRKYLDQACNGHQPLRSRVEELLRSHESASSSLPLDRTSEYVPDQDDRERDDDSHVVLSFLQPSSQAGSIGKLAHYEVLQVRGRGGFGTVLKAFDEKLHRLVAIKVMHPQLAATSPPRKRFLREARAAAAIKHENVVQVYSVDEQPLPYLVMEYIEGQTLQQKLEGAGPLEVPEVLQIARQIASGLAAAHAMGLIHRDVKPGNIMLEREPEQKIKLTDFGLARAADDASMTRTGVVSGTPMYMAPEQALGEALDHRADLFSLGSVLYQMACGRPPFRASATVAVLRRVAEDAPRPMQEILPEIPDWLVAIVAKLHAKKPEDRFQSAKEVADLLTRCQSELLRGGRVESLGDLQPLLAKARREKAAVDESAANLATALDNHAARPVKHFRVALAAVILVLLAGLGLIEATGLTHFHGTVTRLFSPADKPVVEAGAKASAPTDGVGKSSGKPAAQAIDPDRKAAEYVLSIGGRVRVHGIDDEILSLADLPQEPFELAKIVLRENKQVTDADLANCAYCKQLEHLDLVRTSVTDAGLAHFAASKKLTVLDLVGSPIGDAGLASFHGITTLRRLWLSNTNVTDVGLANFFNCKSLLTLDLVNTKITDTGLAHFAGNKNLDDLYLAQTPITDAGLAHFQDNQNLTELWLGETQVTDSGMLYFKDCKNLTKLWLGGTQLTDEGVAHFQDCQNLENLSLMNTWVTDKGLAHFHGCQNLKILWLGYLDVTDAGLAHFNECKNLHEVYLDATQIKDLGLLQFKGNKNLSALSLTSTQVSDEGLTHLTDCENLTYLYLLNTQTTAAGIETLKKALPLCQIESEGD